MKRKLSNLRKGVLYCFIDLDICDENGKLISHKRILSHSLVANYLRFMYEFMRGITNFITVGALANTHPTIIVNVLGMSPPMITFSPEGLTVMNHMFVEAPEADDSFGILVGSGTTAPTPGDYNLAVKILHGTGAGQLYYKEVTLLSPTIVGSTTKFVIIRNFINNSGGDVVVKEIGLCVRMISDLNAYNHVLIARDVLTTPITVPDTKTLVVRYIFQTTV
ncbi:MAG: hypothetical protein QXK24_02075 [Ignisphaera sp.]